MTPRRWHHSPCGVTFQLSVAVAFTSWTVDGLVDVDVNGRDEFGTPELFAHLLVHTSPPGSKMLLPH